MTTDKTKLCHSSSSTMRCSHVSEGKNRGQYVMHCCCLTCFPKLPLQVWWGPAEASRYVDEVNLMNGWMDKNTAQCTLTQVYSLYLQVTQALLTHSKQKQKTKMLLVLLPTIFLFVQKLTLLSGLPHPLYLHVGFQVNTHHVVSMVGLLSNTQMTKKLLVGWVFLVLLFFSF